MVTCGNCSYKKSSRDEHHFCVGCSGCSSETTCHTRMNWHMDFWSYVAKMYPRGGKKLDMVSLCPSSTSFVDMDGILPNDPRQRTETMMADAETRVSSLARVAAVPMSSTVPSHSVAFGNGMMSGRLTSPRPAGPNSHSHVRTERTFSLKDNQESGRLSLSEEGEIVNDCRESGRLSVRSYALSGLSKATRKRLPKGQEGPSKKKSCHVLQVTGYRFSPSIRSARTFSL